MVFKRTHHMEHQVVAVGHLDGIDMKVIKRRVVKMPMILSELDQRQALGSLVNALIRGPRTTKKDKQ
ncbi:hypothetical protein BCA33_01125 [Marinobacter sp. AC-23]|nr:hypothetical protein BCA33_01125 [Marinobacter sp. AC-23]